MVFLRWTIEAIEKRKGAHGNGWMPPATRRLLSREGVYVFWDGTGRPMYVGRAVNVWQRLLSHLSPRGQSFSAHRKRMKLSGWTVDVHFVDIPGASWHLEKRLILTLMPRYNERAPRKVGVPGRTSSMVARGPRLRMDYHGADVVQAFKDDARIRQGRYEELVGIGHPSMRNDS